MSIAAKIARVGVPAALATSIIAAAPAGALRHPDGARPRATVSKAGVVLRVNPTSRLFAFKADGTRYTVTYTATTVWSSELEQHLAAGWHVVVHGQVDGPKLAASKVVNDPLPERTACASAARTIDTAVAAYEAVNSGEVPPTVKSLTTKAGGGPYLTSVPPNGTFYKIALNWGGPAPGKENGGKHPGNVDVAPVWLGKVGTFVWFDDEGTNKGCNAAT